MGDMAQAVWTYWIPQTTISKGQKHHPRIFTGSKIPENRMHFVH
jgi:hypothetical protein